MAKHEDDASTRSFAVLLTQIDDGSLHAELSEELRKVARELADYSANHGGKAKGSIIITLGLTADTDNTVSIVGDVKTKTPKAVRPRTITWIDPAGNLVLSNPKQLKLGVREVPAPEGVRVLPTEATKRSV
jgi:hypothetical protein